jgi:hypothetical protein
VVIRPVNERHARRGVAEVLAKGQPGKAGAEDHNMRVPLFAHAKVFIRTC